MAVSRMDELNVLRSRDDDDKIEEFFEEMELPLAEIRERILLAKDLDDFWLRLFLLILAMRRLSEDVNPENLRDIVRRNYEDILSVHGYDLADPYYLRYVEEIDGAVITTTEENMAYDYYLSGDRAIEIAVNDVNALANYRREVEAIREGKTMKRWVTMRDGRVRKTHIAVDGDEMPIQLPFRVGDDEMLFPLDQSLGAHAKECVNCRCVIEYFD